MERTPQEATVKAAEALQEFARFLRESPHNLLSPRGLEELETRHFPEAMSFAAGLPEGPRLLDLGSGGGLPGIVIAIERPDLDVHLLEATGKKANFLSSVSQHLGLALTVHHGRAEDLVSGELRASFDLVTARAVAPLDRLVPWAAPYLRSGGQLHAIKGERWAEEVEAARGPMAAHRLTVLSTPEDDPRADREGPRVIVIGRTGS